MGMTLGVTNERIMHCAFTVGSFTPIARSDYQYQSDNRIPVLGDVATRLSGLGSVGYR